MIKKKTFSLVLPAYNEELNIRKNINEFIKTGVFDEIIAVDNNSTDKTSFEIKKTSAKYVFEKQQGYGIAIRTGMSFCTSDYIVICEPDGSFRASDIFKFLTYINEFDCVFGTRTAKSSIGKGAKMPFYLRVGNVLVAKLLEYLFLGPTLSDVGCTYKLISQKSYKQIKHKLKVVGSELQPEIMIHLIKNKNKIIEIPVHYLERKGKSKITYNFNSSLAVAIRMVILIITLRFGV